MLHKIMAPSVSPGPATALSILILAASNVGMWLRIADVAAAPRDQLEHRPRARNRAVSA